MTFAASIRLPEAAARRLADTFPAPEEGPDAPLSVDLSEAGPGLWEVVAYYAERPEAEALAWLLPDGDTENAVFTIAELPETDWVAKSLKGLPPVRAGRFLVHGSHDRVQLRSNDLGIEIEAAQAFGTGHHGTTAGCLRALGMLSRRLRPRNALDLGTGSGVLAIAIARLWRIPVLATDIDPLATAIAAANVRHNGVAALVETVTAAGFRHRVFSGVERFDLIVANILAGPLAAMATDLAHRLSPGGVVVLSGLLPEQETRIVAAYRNRGLILSRASVLDGWLTLVLARS